MSDARQHFANDIAIRVHNLSKCYAIYDTPRDRLKQFVLPRLQRFFGKQPKRYYREFWALRDVSFEIRKGETVGIIGRNGSGKSTLLQIICGTLSPTSGSVETRGRIAALLELGSGFNPEFSGRENIYLNGALHGLSRQEIEQRFDAIASFADIGAFIEQPVKTYSSGMFVRLAFAVQVQLSPDVLIVDEALAVGDALFQKRCYQRIRRFIDNGGTLIFVSHDEEVVRTLTSRSLLLSDGRLKAIGPTAEIILDYRRELHEAESAAAARSLEGQWAGAATKSSAVPVSVDKLSYGDYDAYIKEVVVHVNGEPSTGIVQPDDLIDVYVRYGFTKTLTRLSFGIRIRNREGVKVYSGGTFADDLNAMHRDPAYSGIWHRTFEAGSEVTVRMSFKCLLGEGFYEIQAYVCEEQQLEPGHQRMLHWRDEAAFVRVVMNRFERWYGGVCDLQVRYLLYAGTPAPAEVAI